MAATTIVEHFENGSISNIIDIGLKSICAKFHASIPKGTIFTQIYCTIHVNKHFPIYNARMYHPKAKLLTKTYMSQQQFYYNI